jgi:hypothetical protein
MASYRVKVAMNLKSTANAPQSIVQDRKLFAIFFIVMVALTIDISIGTTQDFLIDFAISFWGILLFTFIAAVYLFGSYFLLRTIRAKSRENNSTRIRNLSTLDKIVAPIHYALMAIMAIVVMQVIATSQYHTILLTLAYTISYGLAVFLLGLLAYRFFSWFKINRSLVVLLYGFAAAFVVANAISTIILFDFILLQKPGMVTADSEVIYQGNFEPENPMSIVSTWMAITMNAYFVLVWAGTVLILRHNIHRVGKVKFWALVIPPILFFMGFYITFYETINPPDPNTEQLPPLAIILIILYSAMTAGILFGVGFLSIAKSFRSETNIRDYMLITAYAFIIFFVSSGATIGQAGYPPYGLANVLFVGPSAFLMFTGLYRSAVSVSEDVRLRSLIKNMTKSQAGLLGDMGSAEMQKELEKKVMIVVKSNTDILTRQSGVEPSMSDHEIIEYIHQATKEIKKK